MHSLEAQVHIIGPALVLEADRCRKLALKLRWLGMEKEAEAVTARLPRFLSELCVVIDAPDTD
jgi:hypothetical protein